MAREYVMHHQIAPELYEDEAVDMEGYNNFVLARALAAENLRAVSEHSVTYGKQVVPDWPGGPLLVDVRIVVDVEDA
jgi:hypothetical protein